ncbi:hypothetical protein [Wenzhouxiangella sp. EGI_FJ10409]|uniref:hypothetical protein n=1 Tax=Wenzhouxiangella sp. EGI_FJ10409 TaxID=3243767 RepID=UPI0035E08C54
MISIHGTVIRISGLLFVAGALVTGSGEAQDGIFIDEFQQQLVANIRGLEEGFEGYRSVLARVCDYDEAGLDSVLLNYRAAGTDGWVEVDLVPAGDGETSTANTSACQEYQSMNDLPLVYGEALNDNGLIEWEFQVNRPNGDVDFYPSGGVNTTKYWANEDTAQQTIEDVLNNDDNVHVFCYDCTVNIGGTDYGPYDVNALRLSDGRNFVLEYNGEGRTEDEMHQLKNQYEDASQGSGDFVDILENSIEKISDKTTQYTNNSSN